MATSVRLREAERAYQDQAKAVRELSETHDSGSLILQQAEEKLRQLEAALREQTAQQQQAKTAVEEAARVMADALRAVDRQTDGYAKLTDEQKKAADALAKLEAQETDATYWREKAEKSTGALREVYEKLAESAEKAAAAQGKAGDAAKKVADPVATIADKGTAAATGLDNVAKVDLSKQATDAEKLAAAFTRLAAFDAASFVAELGKVQAALLETTGAAEKFEQAMNAAALAGLAGGDEPTQ